MRRSEHCDTLEQSDLLHDREHFDYVHVSQNNHLKDQSHYDQILSIRNEVKDQPVPLNNIKVYGGTLGWTAGVDEGMQRFWRNIFGGGCSSARFHRPDGGIGLNEIAQANIKSMQMLTDAMNVFACEPATICWRSTRRTRPPVWPNRAGSTRSISPTVSRCNSMSPAPWGHCKSVGWISVVARGRNRKPSMPAGRWS